MSFTGYLPNTSNDRSGLIVVFAAVGACWSLTVLAARLAGRISRRRSLGWEDCGIVASTGWGVAASTAVFVAVRCGFGQRRGLQLPHDVAGDEKVGFRYSSCLSDPIANAYRYTQALYAADILYILALAFSKLAVLQLILGLRPIPQHRLVCWGLGGVTILWAIAGVLVIAIRCDTSEPWTSLTAEQCSDLVIVLWCLLYAVPSLIDRQFARWAALESISLVIEISIFGVAAAMLWMLQMPRGKKLGALIAFAVRLPVVISTALRLCYLRSAFNSSDYALAATGAVIATQCNMHYSIMSASLSYLKPFLAAFDSNLGASTKLETVVATRSSERRKANTAGSSAHAHSTPAPPPDRRSVFEQAQTAQRNGSQDSKAPIIMKTTSYYVDVEH